MGAQRPVTIVDVADYAGVSHSTVSRVLNGRPHVRAATRAKVEQAAADLGYVANMSARDLAGGASGVVGLVALQVSSSYIVEIMRGVDEELADAGLDLTFTTTREENKRERDHVLRQSHGLCDGLIVLVPTAADLYLEELAARSYPLVLVDHASTPHASTVTVDNVASAVMATEHLAALGHRRIGHIAGTSRNAAASGRIAGWRSVLSEHGLDCGDDLLVTGNFLRDAGQTGAGALLDRADPPTAIVAASDLTALGVLDELRARGLRCPEDVSVIGFDDITEATVVSPRLTTVRLPMNAMGREAVRQLLARSERPDDPVAHIELATELVIRESTAPPSR